MPNQMINPSFLCTSSSSQFLILAVSMRSALLKSEKNPLIDHKSKKKNKQAETTYSFPSWEWFAYQCTPTQFHSVVVPPALSESGCRIQVIGVFPKQFLCAKLVDRPDQPYASLYTYSCRDNSLHDVPQMNREDRNLLGAACALLDGCFYVAGGYKVNPSNMEVESTSKTCRIHEHLHQDSLKKAGSFVVGGSKALEHSAEIYNPSTNCWVFLKSFVPKATEGFTIASFNGRLMILTWSVRCEAEAVDSIG